MMDALGLWLKEIVVVILIATFVELLLPGQSMLRYVRTVVGLFIILTILTPIIRFLAGDFEPDRILSAELGVNAGQAEMASLGSVLREGERLMERREREAQELVRRQVEAAMADDLETRFPVNVLQIRAEIGVRENDQPAIRRIQAVVARQKAENRPGAGAELADPEQAERGQAHPDPAEDDAGEPGIAEVRVEDIRIDDIDVPPIMEPDRESRNPAFRPSGPGGRSDAAEVPGGKGSGDGAIEREMADWLAERWDVDRQNIDITVRKPDPS
jgi:stage III sporulation protein AF